MYILENTCGILTTKREFQAVKNAEAMAFIKHNYSIEEEEKFKEGIYQQVAFATKTAPNTYTVETLNCWTYRGPGETILCVEAVGNYSNPFDHSIVKDVKAKSKREAILSVARVIEYNRD